MDQTVRRHTRNRMFETAVKLRENQMNEKLRQEREALLRLQLAKVLNRTVAEFRQLRVNSLLRKLQEAKASLKEQQAHGADRQKTVIVRDLPVEVKQEPDDRNKWQERQKVTSAGLASHYASAAIYIPCKI